MAKSRRLKYFGPVYPYQLRDIRNYGSKFTGFMMNPKNSGRAMAFKKYGKNKSYQKYFRYYGMK